MTAQHIRSSVFSLSTLTHLNGNKGDNWVVIMIDFGRFSRESERDGKPKILTQWVSKGKGGERK